jgi:hypothetical protein
MINWLKLFDYYFLTFIGLLHNYLILIICEYLMDGSLPATPHAMPLHGSSVTFFTDLGN